MNNTPLQTCPKIVKWIFVFFNILFAILGILLIALGSWLVVTGNNFLQATASTAPAVQGIILGGAGLIIFCGLITFVLAAFGVLGGICQARPLLIIFAVGLILIVLIEFIAAIVAFVASGVQPTLINAVTTELQNALGTYNLPPQPVNDAVNTFVDGVQNTFDCCGISNVEDWRNSSVFRDHGTFPPSCCQGMVNPCLPANSTEFHNRACIPAIGNLISTNAVAAVVLGVIALIILLVEFSGIGIAIGLCCCIRSAKLTLV